LWQNRGVSFSLAAGAVNALEPCRKPFHTLPRSQQAAILIQDERFRRWWDGGNDPLPDAVDAAIKAHLGIISKRNLDQPGPTAFAWDELVARYRFDTDQPTWERPA
jgi:hypothetical protein